MRLILIRHGTTDLLRQKRFQGHLDAPLSGAGEREVERLAEGLRGLRPTACLTSDLQRARMTAEILCRRLGVMPQPEPRLRECSFGLWEGLTRAEAEAGWPEEFVRWREKGDAAPGGEAPDAVLERAGAVCRAAYGRWPDGVVLAVSHSLAIRALLSAALGLSLRDSRGKLEVAPASASELEYRDEDSCRIIRVNWQPEWTA
jgi:glucosyl-3-phosphoglycerate phosphatase